MSGVPSMIRKLTDGLFLRCCQATAKKYPEIKFRDLIVDNASMQMVAKPQQFQDCVLVTPNLYGGILSAVGSALVGGMLAAGNYGQAEGVAVFEQVEPRRYDPRCIVPLAKED